jgi:hypothetical protein
MKPTESVTLATWILEHLTPEPYNEALSGDLLEELRSGRPVGWYWRQLIFAIGVGFFKKSRDYALPLFFSTCWSMLYPAWQLSILKNQFTQSMSDRWSALDWPYSASLELGSGILPAATFIWLGFFVYLVLRALRGDKPSGFRILGSLSLSLNVLLIVTIGLSRYLGSSATYPHPLARENFYLSPYHLAISIPLALSLFSALLSALPPPRKLQSTASFTT